MSDHVFNLDRSGERGNMPGAHPESLVSRDRRAALVALLGGAVTLAGCGGGSTPSAPPTASDPVPPLPPPTSSPAPSPLPIPRAATRAKLKAHLNDRVPGLMSEPPAITVGGAGAPGMISGARRVDVGSGIFRFIGTPMRITSDGIEYLSNSAVTGTPTRGSTYHVEFDTDSAVVEVLTRGTGATSAHRFIIDGDYASRSAIAYPENGTTYRTRLAFGGSRRLRRIRMETFNMQFGGIEVEPGAVVTMPMAGNPVRAVFIGGSTVEGIPIAGFPFEGFTVQSAQKMGWSDIYVSGAGGTGYAVPTATSPKFGDRLASDVVPVAPDVVVVAGGYNDPLAALSREAGPFFDRLRAVLPETVIFVTGPIDPRQDAAPKQNVLKTAVANRPDFYFIDNIGERWQTGTGNVAAPRGDGNNDVYTSGDGIHLTPAGHAEFARRLADGMRRVVETF